MTNKVWFQSGIALMMTLVIIFMVTKVDYIFKPFLTIIATIAFPLLLAAVLYYITIPIQEFLERHKSPRWLSIIAALLLIVIVVTVISISVIPIVSEQVHNLVTRTPLLQREAENVIQQIMNQRDRLPFEVNIEEITNKVVNFGSTIITGILSNAFKIIMNTVSVAISLILVPFFYIFMLKDHERLVPMITMPFTGRFKLFVLDTLKDIDLTLRAFIQGQMLVSSILCVILFIGYILIGLDYALLLAIFALFMNVVPFVGPWVAFLPAGILALIQDPMMFVWVSLITLGAQQLESHVITPNVMGNRLKMHPLTVITIVLAAGNIAGFIGILVAIPTYAVLKTIVQNIWRYRRDLNETLTRDIPEKRIIKSE